MELTDKLGLKKPHPILDYVLISDINDNMDVLDEAVGELKEGASVIVDLETTNKTLSGAINEVAYKVKTHEADLASLIKIKKDVVMLSTGWVDDTSNSGFWKYDISDEDMTVDTVVDVNIHLADLEKAESIKSANLSSTGKVTIFADEQPTEDILADLKLIRQVV